MTVAHDWSSAPCALLTLTSEGRVVDSNTTTRAWLGVDPTGCHITDLLSAGGRIYWETHLSPLLHVEGRLDEVAVSLLTSAGNAPFLLSADRVDGGTHVALSSVRERTRYERELVAARSAADRSAVQLRALQGLTESLSEALDVGGVADALVTSCRRRLGAAEVELWLLTDGTWRSHTGGSDAPPAAVETTTGDGPVVAAPRAGTTQHVVRLLGPSGLKGALRLTTPHDLLDTDVDPMSPEVLEAVGRQAGLALDRAELHGYASHVAHELQQSLLAVELPADDRVELASCYRPGVAALEVGGDFFDVFLVAPDLLAVVVGDVVGRGLHAASAMGQLRSAVRALAGPGVGPAALLEALDRFVERVDAASMATIAYAEIDLATGSVTYACAGHPPPLVSDGRGAADFAWEGRSTPLGAFGRPSHRGEAVLQLAPGGRLLLYTDGLVESRTLPLDDGLEGLRLAVEGRADEPVPDSLDALAAQVLHDDDAHDDVCALAVEWVGPRLRRRVRGDLADLSAARRELATWLADQGTGDVDELVLAGSEAIANAAEHGLAGAPEGVVEVTVQLRGEAVVLTVTDQGVWRPPQSGDERGRGMRIIRALVDDLQVRTGGQGTTVELRRSVRPGTQSA